MYDPIAPDVAPQIAPDSSEGQNKIKITLSWIEQMRREIRPTGQVISLFMAPGADCNLTKGFYQDSLIFILAPIGKKKNSIWIITELQIMLLR